MRILFPNVAPIVKYGIGQALADLGHEVSYVFLDREESLAPFIDQFKPDCVFNDGGINRIHKLFPLLADRGIPHIYWAIEDPVQFNDLSLPYAVKSDLVFTPCQESIPEYNRHGINAQLLMFACHPFYHRPAPPDPRYNYDIIFTGNNYNNPTRMKGINDIIRALVDNNYDIKIFGNEWWLDPNMEYSIGPRYYGGYMPNEDLAAACASARIMIGLHSVDTSQTMMSMRTFEILACGGFYLTQWTPAIEYFFQNHHHLVWSKSSVETFELVNWYLEHPAERERIARQGQQEVYDRHTYHHRLQSIMPWIDSIRRPVQNAAPAAPALPASGPPAVPDTVMPVGVKPVNVRVGRKPFAVRV